MTDDVRLFFVYGWRRAVGPFYLATARILADGIRIAEDTLRDRRGFTRTEVRDVRACETLWRVCRSAVEKPGSRLR